MARIRNGILGGFSGKVGNVIGQCYDGVQTMRAMPASVANPKTAGQLAHRSLFASLVSIVKSTGNILRYSLESKNRVFNAFNSVMSFNWRTAVVDGVIDFTKLTFGTFPGQPLDNVTTSIITQSTTYPDYVTCNVGWDSFVNGVNKFETDQIIFISILHRVNQSGEVINFVSNCTTLSITRGKEGDHPEEEVPLLLVSEYQNGDEFYIYLGVNSPETYDQELISKSITIPAHNIPAFKPARSFVAEVRENNDSRYNFDYSHGPWRNRPAYYGS